MNIPNHFSLAELFCGPGGLAVAARKAKLMHNGRAFSIEPVWANDIDDATCRTYAWNIKQRALEEVPDAVVCRDINSITDLGSLPEFDALAFGFPCNDFSNVGETKGLDGFYGPLYTHGVRFINERNPLWFLAENVGGLHSANEGNAFKHILRDLKRSGDHGGYTLTPHLYRFEQYGVPQARHRIIIIGIRNDLGKTFRVPKPLFTYPDSMVSAQRAIDGPWMPPDTLNCEETKHTPDVIHRLGCIPPGRNAWYLDEISQLSDARLREEAKKWPMFAGIKLPSTEKLREILSDAQMDVKSARMSHIYKRLDPHRPSYTITGSGGGGTHVYHWAEPRALTNRERARLQTFPDDFEFLGSKESVRKQIGMAVPPEGARHIFRAVLMTLANIPYESVPANLLTMDDDELDLDAAFENGEDQG